MQLQATFGSDKVFLQANEDGPLAIAPMPKTKNK
jgi:hypothetical protein